VNDQERHDAELSLASLEEARAECERRLRLLTIDNRLPTAPEITEALELTDSLTVLDTRIEDLRRELKEGRPTDSRSH